MADRDTFTTGKTMIQPPAIPGSELTDQDRVALETAKRLLNQPSFAMQLANTLGSPLERGLNALPKGLKSALHKISNKALRGCLSAAVGTCFNQPGHQASPVVHRVAAGLSGCIGGAFGLPALIVELPFSTSLMLRSIADIARSEGHSLGEADVQMECLAVFAYGGPSKRDDAAESAYWSARAALALTLREATAYLVGKQGLEAAAPVIIRLLGAISSRFGVVLSEQLLAKAVPILGMVAGATINVVFITHFQNVARAHFILRRLEIQYGAERVRAWFSDLPQNRGGARDVQHSPSGGS
ncbi:MAG: EcsC family protein [Verrucomicrobia bacterium]|nr:EcsC family protein [Verrucomicrobiota bacterium]